MARKALPVDTIHLRVLGYREGGEWVAHCLETDLLGMGASFGAAMTDLQQATAAQLGFARFKGQPSLLYHPAPLHIVETYNLLLTERLERLNDPEPSPSRAISSFSLPAARKGGFANAL